MRFFGILLWLGSFSTLCAQITESFSDGDFTNNPAWTGNTDHFQVQAGRLQSNGPANSAVISLTTLNEQFSRTEWSFFVSLVFNPSDANHARIYLMSNQADLSSDELNGYFIRIGENGANDGVDLWKQQGNILTKLIDGLPGTVAVNPTVRIRVIRDTEANWEVWADPAGGTQWVKQGSASDDTVQETAYFGVSCVHTVTNRQKFFFDDFEVREAPLSLSRVEATGERKVLVQFSRNTEAASAQQPAHYRLDRGINIIQATQDGLDPSKVQLLLDGSLADNLLYTLTVDGVKDTEGNNLLPGSQAQFRYRIPVRYNEVVITEIFADESPRVGLPDAEYVEIYNRTNRPISLHRFQLTDDNGSGLFPDSLILPKEHVILCSNASVPKFASFGKVIGLSNFSLNNAGETLSLRNAAGQLIYSITYFDTWYKNAVKKEGGWSLEMIDLENACGEEGNWTASENAGGGTPGKVNSVAAAKPDLTPPQVARVEVRAADQLSVIFNEKLDSLSAVNQSSYQIDQGIAVGSVALVSPGFRQVNLSLNAPLQPKIKYTLRLNGLTDCAGNLIPGTTQAVFVLPQPGDSADIILNEVLFNPRSGGVDFVEIYNRSDKYVSLKDWKLANVSDEVIANAQLITPENRVIVPGQYLALTTNAAALKSHYPKSNPENVLVMSSLPTYADTDGTVILLNHNQQLMDRFDYSEDFHFPLIKDKNGVSLERISFDSKANDPAGWRSAASTEDYATPGYRNSQLLSPTANPGGIVVEPRVFTPDEDGNNDFTTLSYAFSQGGQVASIRIFDARGREVKSLAQNQTLATEGYFRWDGTNDRGEKVRTGYYIISIDLFDLNGNALAFREKVVVGAKF
jgi:hypothetical protein